MKERILFPMITEYEKRLPYIVLSVGLRETQEHIVRPDGYPGWHWLHCSGGSGLFRAGGKEFTVREDMGFFLSPGVPHEYYAMEEPWETQFLTFDGNAVPPLIELLGFGRFNVFNITGRRLFDKLLLEIYTAGISGTVSRNLDCSCILYKFLLATRHRIRSNSDHSGPSANLQLHPAVLYMEENFGSQISLEELALKVNISKQHFCRLFKQTYNMRPFEYLTRFRIQKAKEYIIGPENPPVKIAAQMAGYNDTSYFCALFKEYEGITPLEFKRMYKSRED